MSAFGPVGQSKPLASLSSGLLARKGGARPAMRRQLLGGGFEGDDAHDDDLGWNDMGHDHAPHVVQPHAGLTPMPGQEIHASAPAGMEDVADEMFGLEEELVEAPIPAVIEERVALARAVAEAPQAPKVKTPRTPKVQAGRSAKAAFTLRLDPDRHLKLRLACAVINRSAQHIVTEALDNFLNQLPEVARLADQLPHAAGKKDIG